MRNFPKLRSFIKEKAELGVEIRRKSNLLQGLEKHKLHMEKRFVGSIARNAILALCYLREVPYSVQEANSKSRPSFWFISKYIKDIEGVDVTQEDIKNWIEKSGENAKAA